MSRAWRLSGQTAFESDLLESLSLLVLRAGLRGSSAASLISPEELDEASRAVKALLTKFLEAYQASLPGSSGGTIQLSTREHTVFNALRSALIADWDGLEGLLEAALRWVAQPDPSPADREIEFLRRIEAIVASDLHSWYGRLRGAM